MNGLVVVGFIALAVIVWLNFICEQAAGVQPEDEPEAEAQGEWQGCMGDNRRCAGVVVSSIKGWNECAAHVAARIERTA